MDTGEKICFDSEKYLKMQSKNILERLKKFNNKLYMEFGGKLFDDFHASRVLPGFDPNVQIKLLETFKDECEIICVINAGDIEKNKIRADFGITYDMEVLRLIGNFRKRGLLVSAIVITLFDGQPSAITFKNKLISLGERVYVHTFTKGYPTNVEQIVSEEGYGKNAFIETSRPLIVISAPGPGSGKLATCLSQLYHEHKRGVKAGYAKFEKFPVWNLPIKHPVNLAYEAATADLKDVNVLDFYHFDSYGEMAVSYNRDLEVFPVVRNIIKKITNEDFYKSPTDMGFNDIAFCITDDNLAKESAKQEIIRRYLRAKVDIKKGSSFPFVAERIKLLMNELGLNEYDRKCVKYAEEKESLSGQPSVAIELRDGRIVVGRRTRLLCATASMLLNALKTLCEIDDRFELLSAQVYEPIVRLKRDVLHSDDGVLSLQDLLIALAISKEINPSAKMAFEHLSEIVNCKAHSSHILTPFDEEMVRKLGINMSCGDKFVPNSFDGE